MKILFSTDLSEYTKELILYSKNNTFLEYLVFRNVSNLIPNSRYKIKTDLRITDYIPIIGILKMRF